MALFTGPPRWASARRELLDFMVQGKINRGRHTVIVQTTLKDNTKSHPVKSSRTCYVHPLSRKWRLFYMWHFCSEKLTTDLGKLFSAWEKNSTKYHENSNIIHTTTTTVLRSFVRDYLGAVVPEETLAHPPSWSSSNLYQLLPSTTIHSSLLVQIKNR